jgi:hypothetical protein
LFDDVDADRVAPFADLAGDVAGGQVGPDDLGFDGAAGGVSLQNFVEVSNDLRGVY